MPTDSLLEKDVKKGKMSTEEAHATRSRVTTVDSMQALGDADLVMEVTLTFPEVISHAGEPTLIRDVRPLKSPLLSRPPCSQPLRKPVDPMPF